MGLEDGADVQRKAASLEALQAAQTQLSERRLKRKQTAKKVRIDSLPEEQRPTALLPLSKRHRKDDYLPCRDGHGRAIATPFGQAGRGPGPGA